MHTCGDHSFVQSGTGPLPMESSTPHPSETTRDDDPRPSGEWSTCVNSSQSDRIGCSVSTSVYVCQKAGAVD